MHDLNMARRICSHIMLLHDGRLIADGTPRETLCPENVEQVFGVHVVAEHEDGLRFALPEKTSLRGESGGPSAES